MNEEYIETAKNRSFIYNIFSALLCQPVTEINLNPIIFERLTEAIGNIALKDPEIVDTLRSTSQKYSETELLVEYSKLFIGPFKTLAPPYSSVYLGNKNSVYSEDTIWVIQFYRKAGLDFNKEIYDLPDHIAIEMEFMYYLLYNEIKLVNEDDFDNAESYNHYQNQFLQDHLKIWVPDFCDRMIKETNNDFYKLLAENLKWFIETDFVPEFPNK